MSKKIVVITGSPRKKGNSFAMTQAFVNATQELGHTITRFDAAFMNVNGCNACDTCYKTGKACSFDDDFNLIAPAIEESDAVVFTMPLYWYTFPGNIKNIIDKFYSLYRVSGIGGKKCALISCCEENDLSAFDGLKIPYEKSISLLNWENVGEILIPGVRNIGDINQTDGCEKAAKLATLF